MLNLFPCHEFLFLQGWLFLLCTIFLFWLWNNLFLFSGDHLDVAGEAHLWVNLAVSSESSPAILDAVFTRMCSVPRGLVSEPYS